MVFLVKIANERRRFIPGFLLVAERCEWVIVVTRNSLQVVSIPPRFISSNNGIQEVFIVVFTSTLKFPNACAVLLLHFATFLCHSPNSKSMIRTHEVIYWAKVIIVRRI